MSEKQEQFSEGRKKVLALLNQKDRTRWELEDKMQKAGFTEEVIADAIAYAESFHYVDDKRYAERFVEIYAETRSIMRIRQDLCRRHVPEEYIEEALEQIDKDDSRALHREFQKIRQGYGQTLTYQERQKIAASLYRKGFLTDDIFRELDRDE